MKFYSMAPQHPDDPRWRAKSTKNVNYVIRVMNSAEIRIENREEGTTRMVSMRFQILVDNPALVAFVVRGLMDALADVPVRLSAKPLAQQAVRRYLDRLCQPEEELPSLEFGTGFLYRVGVDHVRRYVHEVQVRGR